jgi:MinD-like ATPase involved in chromosome partitioning or flagellar assembly
MRLRTWFDVQRIIKHHTNARIPSMILRIDCFYDAIEIALSDPDEKTRVEALLKLWFGDGFSESVIHLEIDGATIPVEFIFEETKSFRKNVIRPFWEEVEYLENTCAEKSQKIIQLPPPFSDGLKMVAFHSFKGGVGRSLHLVAYLFALLDHAKAIGREIKVLVIDADLESPSLTYWHRQEKPQSTVSLIDFLEAYHYPPTDQESTIAFYAKELSKSYYEDGFYVLPVCSEDSQLLDIRVLPEHIAQSVDGAWECSHAIQLLANALGVNVVLIDLKAGLSDIASPFLFDPRIEPYLITTLSEQSVSGTKLVLEQLSKLAPQFSEEGKYFDPTVVISLLTPELKAGPVYEKTLQRLTEGYKRLKTFETFFVEELLYVSGWADARQKLNGTTMMKLALEWANYQEV